MVMQCAFLVLSLSSPEVSIRSMIYQDHTHLMNIDPPSVLQQEHMQNYLLEEVQRMMNFLFLKVVQVLEPILDLLDVVFLWF